MPELKDILKSINQTKDLDLIDEFNTGDYNPFIVNRIFANFPDTVIQANQMNMRPGLEKRMQYKYMCTAIRKKSRYSPWLKNVVEDDVTLVKTYFNVSTRKAKEMMPLISDKILNEIRNELDKGGRK